MKVIIAAAACLAAALSPVRSETPTLQDLIVAVEGDRYVASCRLDGGLTPEILEEIDAGLETTIGYRFQLIRVRHGLPDETILKSRVRCAVRFDALTKQYTLTRRIDGEVQDTRLTPDAQVMRGFLTAVHRLPLAAVSDLQPDQEYYLRAKADIGLVWRFYLIPWPFDTEWARVPVLPKDGGADHAAP